MTVARSKRSLHETRFKYSNIQIQRPLHATAILYAYTCVCVCVCVCACVQTCPLSSTPTFVCAGPCTGPCASTLAVRLGSRGRVKGSAPLYGPLCKHRTRARDPDSSCKTAAEAAAQHPGIASRASQPLKSITHACANDAPDRRRETASC